MKFENYTKYEIARIIGARALQISMGAPMILGLKKQDLKRIKYNPVSIARLELESGILPLNIKRPLPTKN